MCVCPPWVTGLDSSQVFCGTHYMAWPRTAMPVQHRTTLQHNHTAVLLHGPPGAGSARTQRKECTAPAQLGPLEGLCTAGHRVKSWSQHRDGMLGDLVQLISSALPPLCQQCSSPRPRSTPSATSAAGEKAVYTAGIA